MKVTKEVGTDGVVFLWGWRGIWYSRYTTGREYFKFEHSLASKPMMHALIDNREAIEKLLETAKEVEVTIEAFPYSCSQCKSPHICSKRRSPHVEVTLTAIPADPWPADAIEVWRVKRGVQSKVVWQYEPDYWRDEEGTLGDSAIDALPRDWRKDAPNLVWEQVK